MGMLSRMSTIVKSKMNRIMDQAEDPRETLDYAYDKQLQMLRNVKRGVVEMVTTKRRLELQANKVKENISTLEKQAAQAVNAGREDLARMALQRKQAAAIELDGLDAQVSNLERPWGKCGTRPRATRSRSRAPFSYRVVGYGCSGGSVIGWNRWPCRTGSVPSAPSGNRSTKPS